MSNPNVGAPHTFAQWFNTSAFTLVPAGQYRGGNESTGSVIGPGYETVDLSVYKNIKIYDSLVSQFRFEAFNAFNHTNFTTINTTLGSNAYGQVTNTGQPRNVQIAVKLNF